MGLFSSIHDFRKAGTLAKQSLPHQDPTYLGFVLLFQWTDVPETASGQKLVHGSGATPYSPLFDPMGAEYYLKRLAEITDIDAGAKFKRKLAALQNFKKALMKINKDMPWYWQTLGGLEKLQQTNPLEPYIGGDDSKIAIGCLESVNMAITGLMRLYKEAVFDEEKWTYVVPPNLRKFSVTVYVAEIRDLRMQGSVKETGKDSSTSANSQPPKAGEILKQGFKKSFTANNDPKIAPANSNPLEAVYDADEDLVGEKRKPFFAFHLSNCEFDITSGTTSFESLTNAAPEMSTQLISFNYERLWQVDYKALNGIIENEAMDAVNKKSDNSAPVDKKSQTFGDKVKGKLNGALDKASARAAQDLVNLAEKKKQEAISAASNAVRDATGIPFSMDGMKPKLELEGVYQNFVNKVDQATNIQRLTSKALANLILGNVYIVPGQTIGDTLNNAVARALGNVYRGR
jgi:hypothetical protein